MSSEDRRFGCACYVPIFLLDDKWPLEARLRFFAELAVLHVSLLGARFQPASKPRS